MTGRLKTPPKSVMALLVFVPIISHVLSVVVVVCWLLNVPSNMLVYLKVGSAQRSVRAATLI